MFFLVNIFAYSFSNLNLMVPRTTVEKLLEKGFQPKRTIVLAFGIDEERGGNVVSHTITK